MLGTPEVPLVEGSVVLAGRETRQGHSWPQGARTRDQVAIKSQPMVGLLHWAPVVLKPLASTLPGAISSQKASVQAPGRPFVARDWLKPPSASLCIELPLPTSSDPALTVVLKPPPPPPAGVE